MQNPWKYYYKRSLSLHYDLTASFQECVTIPRYLAEVVGIGLLYDRRNIGSFRRPPPLSSLGTGTGEGTTRLCNV